MRKRFAYVVRLVSYFLDICCKNCQPLRAVIFWIHISPSALYSTCQNDAASFCKEQRTLVSTVFHNKPLIWYMSKAMFLMQPFLFRFPNQCCCIAWIIYHARNITKIIAIQNWFRGLIKILSIWQISSNTFEIDYRFNSFSMRALRLLCNFKMLWDFKRR